MVKNIEDLNEVFSYIFVERNYINKDIQHLIKELKKFEKIVDELNFNNENYIDFVSKEVGRLKAISLCMTTKKMENQPEDLKELGKFLQEIGKEIENFNISKRKNNEEKEEDSSEKEEIKKFFKEIFEVIL